MANAPKKVNRPWVAERTPFSRERTASDFDYNGRKWRNVRKRFLEENPLCCDCKAAGIVTLATVADHDPTAKVLISKGLDPYDPKYLFPRCDSHHNSKSGREAHKGGMGSNP
jgi:5-methylcytosine-specific restriction protein A